MVKSLLYFQLQRLIGSRVANYYEEFLRLERADSQDVKTLQENRLNAILKHARENVPFYRQRVSESSDLSLSDFPVLTKDDLRRHYLDIMTNGMQQDYQGGKRKSLYSWVEVKSGGTTGIPISVIHDSDYRDRGRAGRLYSQYLCGFPQGTPYFRLWGSMNEINEMRDSIQSRILSYLSGQTLMNAFRMREKDIRNYISLINDSSVEHMMAYVDAAHEMASYAKKNQMYVKPLNSIMACAGTVTEDIRQTLRDVFGARVHNKYGSRDCAEMACECDHGGFHIYANNVCLEIVDDHGSSCAQGEIGRILVTLLHNNGFPIIRYEIGDMGALCGRSCECGRPFPLLDRVEGRNVEFLNSVDGGYVSPVYIRHLIGVVHNPGYVRKFQLIQEDHSRFSLFMQMEGGVSHDNLKPLLDLVERDLKAVLGEGALISITIKSELEPAAGGKYLYTVNRLRQ